MKLIQSVLMRGKKDGRERKKKGEKEKKKTP